MNSTNSSLLIFSLDDKRYACESAVVERIFRAIEITEIPNAEKNILGIINLHGEIVPVIDIRKILGIQTKKNLELEDIMVVFEGKEQKMIGMVVDSVNYLEAEKSRIVPIDENLSTQKDYFSEVLKDPEGTINIVNMNNIIGQVN